MLMNLPVSQNISLLNALFMFFFVLNGIIINNNNTNCTFSIDLFWNNLKRKSSSCKVFSSHKKQQ